MRDEDLNKPDDVDKGIPGWGKENNFPEKPKKKPVKSTKLEIKKLEPVKEKTRPLRERPITINYSINQGANLFRIIDIAFRDYEEKQSYGILAEELEKSGIVYSRDTFNGIYFDIPRKKQWFKDLQSKLREDSKVREALDELKSRNYSFE